MRLAMSVLVCAALAGATSQAAAFSIEVVEFARNDAPGEDLTWNLVETPDLFDDDGTKREKTTSLAVIEAPAAPVADTVGATATFTTRYAGVFTADGDADEGVLQAYQVAYRIVFDVDACAACAWNATVEAWWAGAVTIGNDTPALFFGASAVVEDPIIGVDGVETAPGLGFVASTNSGGDVPFAGAPAPIELSGVGALQHQLDFRAVFSLQSRRFGSGGQYLPSDEVTVRLGRAGSLTGVPTDDYPGSFPRVMDDDGIFARVTVTLAAVPEPDTALLLAAGVLALAARRR